MMNIPKTAGEPSCKRQENGDASNGSDRPLKKARFAWQVKGKYHLKNDNPESSTAAATSEHDAPASSSHNVGNLGNSEQNLEILGDYLLKQDFNTLDSVITDADKTQSEPGTSSEKLAYPRYVCSQMPPCIARRDKKSRIAVSMVDIQDFTEDQCIARWQAKQMAQGFVDNTINHVLDSWRGAPLAGMENRPCFIFDITQLDDNIPEDDNTSNIENEGILMAISAHGLQNNSSSSSDSDSRSEEMFCRNVPGHIFLSQSRSSSPFQSEEECEHSTVQTKCICPEKLIEDDDGCGYKTWRRITEIDEPTFRIIREASSPTPYDDLQNPSIPFDDGHASGSDILTNHFDFMDTAVSFAIQNKGLASFSTGNG